MQHRARACNRVADRLWRDGCVLIQRKSRAHLPGEEFNSVGTKGKLPASLCKDFRELFVVCCGQSALCLKPSPQMLISHPVKRPKMPDMFELTDHEHMLYCKLMPLYLLPQALKAWLYYTALRFQLSSHSIQPLLRLYRSDAE